MLFSVLILLFLFPPLLSSVLDAVGKRRKQRFQVVSYPFVFQSLETVKACRHSRDHDGVYVGVVCSNAGAALVQRADDLTAEAAILEREFKPVPLHVLQGLGVIALDSSTRSFGGLGGPSVALAALLWLYVLQGLQRLPSHVPLSRRRLKQSKGQIWYQRINLTTRETGLEFRRCDGSSTV